ncbi:hypothetical protein SAMN05428989_2061 [Pseudoxanthomonas sp. GM95]|uniref:hypothetical protein n=1 Tax=Pseudoxanthomonas sp. GM95 TaxID=1881043 RepID=UPI0008D49EA1|nr:hypothetical protein [Pseudoxanthomonas sp. GM95]SEL61260.1 hypothetical protein SAMN05428989_2061 [Pseudoxanthomonas sp. GM95]
MSGIQKELVQERVSGVALRLACHASDTNADRTTWAASLLLAATRDLAAPERLAVRKGVHDVLQMFELERAR